MRCITKLLVLAIILVVPLRAIWFQVCVDAGHSGDCDIPNQADDCNGYEEPNESDINLDMAWAAWDHFQNNHQTSVLMTRVSENCPFQSWEDKGKIANGEMENELGHWTNFPVSMAVSIHNNGWSTPEPHGTETYWSAKKPLGYSLALRTHYVLYIGVMQYFENAHDRGVKQESMGFINTCSMPAILVEPAFLSNPIQWAQMRDNVLYIRQMAGIYVMFQRKSDKLIIHHCRLSQLSTFFSQRLII